MGEPNGYCLNCKRSDIPAQNLDIHVVQCKRNSVVCPTCGLTLPRALLEEHHETTHAQQQCPLCQATMASALIDAHVADSCPMRQLECYYCQLGFAHKDLADHVTYCGSRTERCELCTRFVMLKDRLRHEETGCGFPPPPPPPSDAAAAASSRPAAARFGDAPWLQPRVDDGSMLEFWEEQLPGASRRPGLSGGRQGDGIPCEFCNQTFGAEEIMDHQIHCIQSMLGDSMQAPPAATRSLFSTDGSGDTVVNRLLSTLQLEGSESTSGFINGSTYFDDVVAADMVPCEFCSTCLPMDLLPHHQDVCARLPTSLRSPQRMAVAAARLRPGGLDRAPAAPAAPAAHRRSPAGAAAAGRSRPAQDARLKALLLERAGAGAAAARSSSASRDGGLGPARGGSSQTSERVRSPQTPNGGIQLAAPQLQSQPAGPDRGRRRGTPTRRLPTTASRQPVVATTNGGFGGSSASLGFGSAGVEGRSAEVAGTEQPEVWQGSEHVAGAGSAMPTRSTRTGGGGSPRVAATDMLQAMTTRNAGTVEGGQPSRRHGGVPMQLSRHARGFGSIPNATRAPDQSADSGASASSHALGPPARAGHQAPKMAAELTVAGTAEASRSVPALAGPKNLAGGRSRGGGGARRGTRD